MGLACSSFVAAYGIDDEQFTFTSEKCFGPRDALRTKRNIVNGV